jgi:hypothetical protein
MPTIHSSDPDFRVCRISFPTLLEIQLEAEERGWGTRWSSEHALRRQVKEGDVLLQSFMREERGGVVHSYRCLLIFSTPEGGNGGGMTTMDLNPPRFFSLERIDRDPDVRKAFVRMFSLAMNGISMTAKQ